MYSSIRIADEFLKIAKERGCKDMIPMKLIQLVYLAHGMSLAHCGEPLIRDAIEAWRYGPVLPTLYGQVSAYGGSPVKDVSAGGNLDELLWIDMDCQLSDKAMLYIKATFIGLGERTAASLCRLTHAVGSPWDQTMKKGKGTVIPDEITEKYYKDLYFPTENTEGKTSYA